MATGVAPFGPLVLWVEVQSEKKCSIESPSMSSPIVAVRRRQSLTLQEGTMGKSFGPTAGEFSLTSLAGAGLPLTVSHGEIQSFEFSPDRARVVGNLFSHFGQRQS